MSQSDGLLSYRDQDGAAAFDVAACRAAGSALAERYAEAAPFPHIVIDDLIDPDLLADVLNEQIPFVLPDAIDRLIAQGVILGFSVRLHPEAEPGQVRAIMSIEIEGRSSPAVMKALRGVAEVEAVHTTNGRWDLVAQLCAADLPAFSGALDAIRQIDGIVSTETSLLLQTHRF